ncbi:hypothetical protein LSAT2_028623 [Lamellibrachia satsuma]|nr:hypothetical protein LSAT2_028623 [Lamellibrachia satsuma]
MTIKFWSDSQRLNHCVRHPTTVSDTQRRNHCVRHPTTESLCQTPNGGITVSDTERRSPCVRHRTTELLFQTPNDGITVSDTQRRNHCVRHRTTESLCETPNDGVTVSDTQRRNHCVRHPTTESLCQTPNDGVTVSDTQRRNHCLRYPTTESLCQTPDNGITVSDTQRRNHCVTPELKQPKYLQAQADDARSSGRPQAFSSRPYRSPMSKSGRTDRTSATANRTNQDMILTYLANLGSHRAGGQEGGASLVSHVTTSCRSFAFNVTTSDDVTSRRRWRQKFFVPHVQHCPCYISWLAFERHLVGRSPGALPRRDEVGRSQRPVRPRSSDHQRRSPAENERCQPAESTRECGEVNPLALMGGRASQLVPRREIIFPNGRVRRGPCPPAIPPARPARSVTTLTHEMMMTPATHDIMTSLTTHNLVIEPANSLVRTLANFICSEHRPTPYSEHRPTPYSEHRPTPYSEYRPTPYSEYRPTPYSE